MLRLSLRTFLPFSFILGLALSADAQTDFKGLWIVAGAKSAKDQSSSSANYTVHNKFGGSFASPGYVAIGSYQMEAQNNDENKIPTLKLMYLTQVFEGWIGISVGADAYPERKVLSKKFDITSPTGAADYPRGFQMTNVIEPTMDLQVAAEPGILIFPSLMAFVKIAYHKLDMTIKSEGKMDSGLAVTQFANTASKYSFECISGGFGFRWLLTDKIMIEPSFDYVDFPSQKIAIANLTSAGDEFTLTQNQEIKFKWTMLSVSLGYQF
jgi:hypothetical protein